MTRVARLLFCLLLAAYAQGWEVQHDTGSEILNHTGMMGVIKLEDGTSRIQVQEFKGASKLSVLKHLWETAEVVVECAGHKDFTVFTGPSMEAVRAAYAAKQSAWCGFDRALGRTAACHASISPFGTTAVAVVKPKGWFGDGGAEAAPCTLRREATFSIYRFLASLLGSYLFWNAPTLASNTAFRLTGGTLGFMALSSAVLLFILYRQVPRKRSLAAGAALFGSTFLGALRYMFGTWFPSWSQLLRSPVFLGYFALSGLSGLALTYWYNNPENHKVNTMLNVALHLVGLGLSAAGPSLPEASAAWVASLLGARLVSLLTRHRSVSGLFDQAKRAAQQMAAVGEEELEGLAATKPVKGAQLAVARAGKQLAQQQRKLWPFGNRGGGGASATAGVNNGGAEAAGRGKAGGDGEFAAGAAAAPAPGSGRYTPVLVTARGGPAGDLVAAVEGSGGTPVVGTPHAVAEAEISPLVQRGLVLNEETGHLIHIGKATYNRLVASGYSVDRSKGVITPPPASPTSPIGSPRGSGRGGTRRRRV